MQAINLLFQAQAAGNMTHINHLLNLTKEAQLNVILEDEPSWKTIEKKYVATFPMRGIGSVQWTRSKKMEKRKGITAWRVNEQRCYQHCYRKNIKMILMKSLRERFFNL